MMMRRLSLSSINLRLSIVGSSRLRSAQHYLFHGPLHAIESGLAGIAPSDLEDLEGE